MHVRGDEEAGAVRAAPHEDIDLLSILPAATTTGLQVKDTEGNWHDVESDPGTNERKLCGVIVCQTQ